MSLKKNPTLEQIKMKFPRVEWQKISDLNDMDPSGHVVSRLIQIFDDEMKVRIAEMKTHLVNEDFSGLSKTIHRFRSTTYNLGARCAAEITKQIDVVLDHKPVDKIELDYLIYALEQECRAAYQDLISQTKLSNAA